MVLMGIASLGMGILPTYTQIGIYAPALMLLFRVIQGLAIGGELPSMIVYVSESMPEKRGFAMGGVFSGTVAGLIPGMLINLAIVHNLSIEQINSFGWRIPFILGGFLCFVAYRVRKELHETNAFKHIKQHNGVPFIELLKNHFGKVIIGSGLTAIMATPIVLVIIFMPTYLAAYYHFPMAEILKYNSYSIIIFIVSAFLAGKFHYFFGKSFLIISVIIFNLVNFTVFTHYSSLSLMQIVAFHYVILLYIGIICGRLPVLSASFFPVQVRYSGVGLSYNISFGIVAGLTQMLLFAGIKLTGLLWLPAIYILLFSIFALIFLFKVSAEKLVNYY